MPLDDASTLKFLPAARWQVKGGGGRTSARRINELRNPPRETTVTVAASGATVPILYGRRDVPGLLGPVGQIGSDFVYCFIWCIGEVDAIEAIYLNDAVPPGGVTVTHYTGTPTQAADATLQAAIAGYNDSLRFPTPDGFIGVAYSVVRIPSGVVEGFPRARAVIRGMKQIYDPRTDTYGYTDNSALCMGHYISTKHIGAGTPIVGGLADCADWCDSLLGGASPRARLALLMIQPRPVEEYIELLSEYAEAFYVPDGLGYRLIPNKPVDLGAVPVITGADVMDKSIQVEALSELDAPTEIVVTRLDPPTDPTQPWATIPDEPVALPGVAEGTVRRVTTGLSLEGVFRTEEQANKGISRLYRNHNRVQARWRSRDLAVTYQKGDVVIFDHPPEGVHMLPVRVMDVSLAGLGRYDVSGERYDHSHYPADLVLPSTEGTVPVGAIGLLVGETVPDGWELFTAANGRYIRGAGGGVAPGDTGGDDTVPAQAGTTTSDGAHDTPKDMPTPRTLGGTSGHYRASTAAAPGNHSHSWSISSFSPGLYRFESRLVKKVGTPSTRIPPSVMIFGLPNLTGALLTKVVDKAGRLLRAASATALAGSESITRSATVGNASNSHQHTTFSGSLDTSVLGPESLARDNDPSGGTHTHTASGLGVDPRPKRQQLCLFGLSAEAPVYPGTIMGLDPAESIPADWVLCNGTSGTPDTTDRLVQLAGATPAAPAGDDTLRISGRTAQHGHHHNGGELPAGRSGGYYAHAATVYHDHGISVTVPWVPAWYAVNIIMYAPGI